jgi:hypothetical protein
MDLLLIPVDFAIVAYAFGPVKDSIIRVSMVGDWRYSIVLRLLCCFVCNASGVDALTPIRSEVSWVVRIVD